MVDVVVIGGALTGGSTAYHLLSRDPGLRVTVVEPDPTYEFAASSRSIGGVRVLFSQEENVRMSQFGHAFYGDFAALMAVGGEPAALDYRKDGYLYIANNAEQAEDMAANHALQTSLGARVDLLDAAGLAARVPALDTSDVAVAAHAPEDGWIDPNGALAGFRRKALSLGAQYRRARVRAIEDDGRLVRAVVLDTGERIEAQFIVNAAGAWAGEVCALVGMEIPVAPLPRMVFYFETPDPPQGLPLVRDGRGVGFRPEGAGFISGITDHAIAGRFRFEVEHAWFEERVWPGLARRLPAFETLKVKNAWAGHYAQNGFDGNMIIGAWIGGLENFLIATGFSGHGLQHAPAVGRALAELILDRRFVAIDLARFSFQRILDDAPDPERGFRA
jgi:glycine/D-amino acid oxidase-like deaminating enzyme